MYIGEEKNRKLIIKDYIIINIKELLTFIYYFYKVRL